MAAHNKCLRRGDRIGTQPKAAVGEREGLPAGKRGAIGRPPPMVVRHERGSGRDRCDGSTVREARAVPPRRLETARRARRRERTRPGASTPPSHPPAHRAATPSAAPAPTSPPPAPSTPPPPTT